MGILTRKHSVRRGDGSDDCRICTGGDGMCSYHAKHSRLIGKLTEKQLALSIERLTEQHAARAASSDYCACGAVLFRGRCPVCEPAEDE